MGSGLIYSIIPRLPVSPGRRGGKHTFQRWAAGAERALLAPWHCPAGNADEGAGGHGCGQARWVSMAWGHVRLEPSLRCRVAAAGGCGREQPQQAEGAVVGGRARGPAGCGDEQWSQK